MIKKLLCLMLLLVSGVSDARVPLDQSIDFYRNTKDEYKNISPAWAEVALQSGVTKNIRFFGHYSSEEHPDIKPHPAFNNERDTLKLNAPQDGIAALYQYLFPSPNGQIIAINQRENDPIGKLGRKANLSKINDIVLAIVAYEKDKNHENLAAKVDRVLESVRSKSDNKKKTRPKYDGIKANFIKILVAAVQQEENWAPESKYPQHAVFNAFFSLALMVADSAAEIYATFPWLFCDAPAATAFDENDYKALKQQLAADPKFENGVDVEKLVRVMLGYAFFEEKFPKPLTYVNTFYTHHGKKIAYPNCGETSMLNFFYYVWNDKGVINPAFIQATEEKLQDALNENWQKLKAFFIKYNTIGLAASREAQTEWSHIVSNLNDDSIDQSLRVTYRQDVCNLMGIGVINMLNVLEKFLPDATLHASFPESKKAKFKVAEQKMDRLTALFSREGHKLNWEINYKKNIKDVYSKFELSINDQPLFYWSFSDHYFECAPLQDRENDWRRDIDWSKVPLPIQTWMHSEIPKLMLNLPRPSSIYAFNMHSMYGAAIVIDQILANRWVSLYDQVAQIIGRGLHVEDRAAQRVIYALLHKYDNGMIYDKAYHALDYKTYLPADFTLTKKQILKIAGEGGLWSVVKSYSVEDNVEAAVHVSAVDYGMLPMVKWLCEAVPGLEYRTAVMGNYNLVDWAVIEGQFEVLDYFNPAYDYVSNAGKTLLHLIAQSHEDRIIQMKKFINKGVSLDAKDVQGNTALHNACDSRDNISNIKYLIDQMIIAKVSLDTVNNCNETPLFSSLAHTNNEAFFYLVKKGANITHIGPRGMTMLHNACVRGKLEVVQFLVEQKDFDINQKDENHNTALHYACQGHHADIIRYLISQGADVQSKNDQKRTPLHNYLQNMLPQGNFIDIVDLLLERGCDLNQADADGITPMQRALSSNISIDGLKQLESKGGAMPQQGDGGPNPLFAQCSSNTPNVELMRYFIDECGYSAVDKDANGNTVLHKAVECSKPKIIDFLLLQGADIHAINNLGQSPLHMLVATNNAGYIMGDYDDDEDIEDAEKEEIEEGGFVDGRKLRVEILDMLLEKGADIDAKDDNGRTLLLSACKWDLLHDPVSFIEELIKRGASSIKDIDNDGNNAIHIFASMCCYGQVDDSRRDLLKFLSDDKGVEFDAPNNKGETPLMLAARSGDLNKVKALVELGADVTVKAHNGATAIMGFYFPNLFKDGKNCYHIEAIHYLLSKGASLEDKNQCGQNFTDCLLDRGGDDLLSIINEFDLQFEEDIINQKLLDACRYGNATVIRTLMPLGADIHAVDGQKNTLLHILAPHLHNPKIQKVADQLIAQGLDIHATNAQKQTVLVQTFIIPHWNDGKQCFNFGAIKYLLSKGANIGDKDKLGRGLVDYLFATGTEEEISRAEAELSVNFSEYAIDNLLLNACQHGNIPAMKYCLDHGANIHAKNSSNGTPLGVIVNHRIYQDGKTCLDIDAIKYLLSRYADEDLPQAHIECVDMAFINCSIGELQHLCAELELDISGIDADGNSVLHRVLSSSYVYRMNKIEDYLKLDVDINYRNNLGQTALMKFFDSYVHLINAKAVIVLVDEFLKQGADLHIVDNDGNTLIAIFISNIKLIGKNVIELYLHLLDQGCAMDERDSEGKTFLHRLCAHYSDTSETLRILIDEKGADFTILDNDGKPPYYYVEQPVVAQYFMDKGIKFERNEGKRPYY
jgi:ankyrin repeat protein